MRFGYELYTACAGCGDVAHCKGDSRYAVRCSGCAEAKAALAPGDELGAEFEREMLVWIRVGTKRGDLPSPAECNRRILADRDSRAEAARQQRREYERVRGEIKRAETQERHSAILADVRSGRFTMDEVADAHRVSVGHVKKLQRRAA